MTKGIRCFCLLFLVFALPAYGNEQVRQVQEELRKRNLFFGDVDGKGSADLVNSLKRYQKRKGFAVTGTIDVETATSLNIQTMSVAASKEILPDVPILRSDIAREIEEAQRQQLAQQAEQNLDSPSTPAPEPPAEEPPPSQNLTPERVRGFVEQYLRDGETQDLAAQTRYFAYPVEYFDHGSVGPEFVEKDVANYCKRWPTRKYMMTEPVTFAASAKEGETIVEFPIAFDVQNKKYRATGRTRNTWRIRPEGDELKIVAIREERLRD